MSRSHQNAPGRTRTRNQVLSRQPLYPIELRGHSHGTLCDTQCMREDENQIASVIVAAATSQSEKNQSSVALPNLRAKKLTPERRREIAAKAAATRWRGKKK